MLPGHAEYQTFPRPEIQSAQWESNPHIRHGKAVGYRYIMGAWLEAGLSKIESTGRDSNPRRRITGAVSLPLDDQCLIFSGTRGTRTLTRPVKSRGAPGARPEPCAGSAAANTFVPSIESARRESNPSTWSL